jgi:hypothetical protein
MNNSVECYNKSSEILHILSKDFVFMQENKELLSNFRFDTNSMIGDLK